ncbi:MAG: AarF/UbiB family protein [Actinomycetota bacterium]
MRTNSGLLTDASLRRLTPREALRSTRISLAVARHILPGLVRKKHRTPQALAPRVRRVVVALGPPFVKLSQLVSSSPSLFPAAISDELRDLLDSAPAERWEDMREIVEQDLGAPVEALFASIDPEPLAAASIAQVHAVTLRSGEPAVVKVRRPGVERRFLTDLRLLRVVARLAQRFSAHARVLNPVVVVDDVVATLRQELDFEHEAAAMERFERNLRSFGSNDLVRAPSVHRSLSGRAVLTMERIEGTKVDDLVGLTETGFDLLALLRAGVRAWIEGACEHRFFHGDVHAGNLLVDRDGRVVFLDFGITGELDVETTGLVRRGVVALLHTRDFREVTRCLADLGARMGGDGTVTQAAAAIERLVEPLLDQPIGAVDYQAVFSAAVRMAAPHGVQLPRSLVLLAKQVLYFERYAKLVAPDYDILADPFLIEFMFEGAVREASAPVPALP